MSFCDGMCPCDASGMCVSCERKNNRDRQRPTGSDLAAGVPGVDAAGSAWAALAAACERNTGYGSMDFGYIIARHRPIIEAAIRAEAPAPSMPSMLPAVGLDVDVLDRAFAEMHQRGWIVLPDGHGVATFRDVFVESYARLAPTLAPVGDGLRAVLAAGMADALTVDWPGDTRLKTAPAIVDYLLALPAVRAALAATEDPDHAGWPTRDDFRRMSPREVNAFLESRNVSLRVKDTEDPDHAG